MLLVSIRILIALQVADFQPYVDPDPCLVARNDENLDISSRQRFGRERNLRVTEVIASIVFASSPNRNSTIQTSVYTVGRKRDLDKSVWLLKMQDTFQSFHQYFNKLHSLSTLFYDL